MSRSSIDWDVYHYGRIFEDYEYSVTRNKHIRVKILYYQDSFTLTCGTMG